MFALPKPRFFRRSANGSFATPPSQRVVFPHDRVADDGRDRDSSGVSPLAALAFDELDVRYDATDRTCWCWMRPHNAASFTPTILQDLIALRRAIQAENAGRPRGTEAPVKYAVGGSLLPRIYNLGGDLGLFLRLIRSGDRAALQAYAYDCVNVIYHSTAGLEAGVVTIALVQGDALGGGFEGALACNVLIAERSARFGLPEIGFNLFPGMGAHCLLFRRLGPQRAQDMILSGEIFTAEALHAMGLVDVLAEDGEGAAATRDFIRRNSRRHNAQSALYRARQNAQNLTHDELRRVTDVWVDAALNLTDADLRRMERLVTAQGKRLATLTPQAVPASGMTSAAA